MNPIADDQAGRYVLRPSGLQDLDALETFAEASAHGVTTLPHDRDALALRLERSLEAFSSEDTSGEETYLFVLEDNERGQVVGVSGIAARAGFSERFYTYRSEFLVHRSAGLNARNRIHTLHPCHDLTGVTLLTSYYLLPAYHATVAAELLSRARLLFILHNARDFSDRIAAESPGLADADGYCPFWDAVGRRFFGMDYPAAERIAEGRSKSFIAELMPASPLYVPLLPEEAQWAIGQLHPDAQLPFSILLDEGMEADTYVDIFDAGPIAQARLGSLRSVAGHLAGRLRGALADGSESTTPLLVSNDSRTGFRATVARGSMEGGHMRLDGKSIAALELDHDAVIHATPFSCVQRDRT